MPTPAPQEPTTQEDWTYIQSLLPRFVGSSSLKWIGGVSPRLGRDRLGRLLALRAAAPLTALFDQRSAGRIKALRTYAAVNMEQASAALRMTIVVNVSIPVIIVAILSQISSGKIWASYWSLFADSTLEQIAFAAPAVIALLILMIILGLGASRLGQARDIRHLIDLLAAERGIYFGMDDMDDSQAD